MIHTGDCIEALRLLHELVDAVRSGNVDGTWTDREEQAIYAARAFLAALPPSDQPSLTDEALRLLLKRVLDEFDFWTSEPRPAVDGGTVRIHNFAEVQPSMERALSEARAALAVLPQTEPA